MVWHRSAHSPRAVDPFSPSVLFLAKAVGQHGPSWAQGTPTQRKVRGFPGCGKKQELSAHNVAKVTLTLAVAATLQHACKPALLDRGPDVHVSDPAPPGPAAPPEVQLPEKGFFWGRQSTSQGCCLGSQTKVLGTKLQPQELKGGFPMWCCCLLIQHQHSPQHNLTEAYLSPS